MTGNPQPIRAAIKGTAAYLLTAAGLLAVYFPILDNYYISAQFYMFGPALHNGFTLNVFLQPVIEHIGPLWRIFFGLEYLTFGHDPSAYFVVTLCLHWLNVFLTGIFFSALLRNGKLGYWIAFVFGFSASYVYVIHYVFSQMHLFNLTCFLTTSIFYLHFLRRPRPYRLAVVTFCHLFTLFSWETGLELPLLYFLLFLVARNQGGIANPSLKFGMWTLLPLWINTGIYAWYRLHWPGEAAVLGIPGGVHRTPG